MTALAYSSYLLQLELDAVEDDEALYEQLLLGDCGALLDMLTPLAFQAESVIWLSEDKTAVEPLDYKFFERRLFNFTSSIQMKIR